MNRFQFRFASILRLRRRQRDDVRREIATCLATIESLSEQIADCHHEQSALLQNPKLRRIGRVSLETLQYTQRQGEFLRFQLQQLQHQLAGQETELAQQQTRLAAAQIEVKRYETLEASDAQRHRHDQQRIANRHAA